MSEEETLEKMKKEIEWLKQREKIARSSLKTLVGMVDDILNGDLSLEDFGDLVNDKVTRENRHFIEIFNQIKEYGLREPWQVKLSHPPIDKGKLNIRIKRKDGDFLEEE
tara:strand:+ start:120 stop:446 length:327 start_codon:yes stop_codon:yes gene_type:complete